jgi:hypothetical protein
MKFKLVEDTYYESVLVEAKVYEIKANGISDPYYMIAGNKDTFNTSSQVKDYISLLKNKHETVSKNVDLMLSEIDDPIQVTRVEDKNQLKDIFSRKERFLNYTHRTYRKNSSVKGFITHHLDGIEANNDEENLLRIKEDEHKNGIGKFVHTVLHKVDFDKQKLSGSKPFDVQVYDGNQFVDKKLIITAKIV